MKNHLLVFVPGILGTELYFGCDAKVSAKEGVWSGSLQTLCYTLARDPRRLYSATPLGIGPVLREFNRKPFGTKIQIYGPLIDFLTDNLGYKLDSDLLTWGYDWRQSNLLSAEQLASELRSKMSNGIDRIKLVCHSMGGLVVRLMLSDARNIDILDRCQLVVQIGTPVRGSASAFRTLKDSPQFEGLFGFLLDCSYWFRPKSYHRLMTAIRTFDSLFELLPPESQQILHQETDFRYSAVDSAVWPEIAPERLAAARRIHSLLASSSFEFFRTIYSSNVSTESGYLVDEYFDYVAVDLSQQVRGDGIVSVASAMLGTRESSCELVRGAVRHNELPSDTQVFTYLKAHL